MKEENEFDRMNKRSEMNVEQKKCAKVQMCMNKSPTEKMERIEGTLTKKKVRTD